MLLTMGVLYVLIGYGEVARTQAFYSGAYHLLIPAWVRAVLWIACGIGACYFAFTRHHSGTRARWWQTDTFGWFLLYLPPLMRVTSYAGAFGAWLFTDTIGDPGAWVPMSIYGIPILIVIICSGWVENPRREFCL